MERREFIAMLASTPAVSISSAAEAQTATPAAAPKPLSITLLGTGTPSPSLDRQSSGYLIEVGHDVIVWDHGPGAHHRLLQSASCGESHTRAYDLHYDHAVTGVVLQRWDQGADRVATPGYGPAERRMPNSSSARRHYGRNCARIETRAAGSVRGARRQAAAPTGAKVTEAGSVR